MAFCETLRLVYWLEGTQVTDDPIPTNSGMTQSTWEKLGFTGKVTSVKPASGEIATAYRKLWDSCTIYDYDTCQHRSLFDLLPEPADAVAFQAFINLPWVPFHKIVQECLGVTADGFFGKDTYYALIKHHDAMPLCEALLHHQEKHYNETAKPEYLEGLLNRIKKVDEWLTGKSPWSSSAPL